MYARGIQSFHYSSPAKITRNIAIFAEKKKMTWNKSFIFFILFFKRTWYFLGSSEVSTKTIYDIIWEQPQQ